MKKQNIIQAKIEPHTNYLTINKPTCVNWELKKNIYILGVEM